MMQIVFTVPGEPRGKGRPRFARRGNFVQTYTDAKTLKYEDAIQFCAKQAMGSSKPLECPVSVYLYIRVSIPASYSKAVKKACLEGDIKPTKKPDADNTAKVFLDAFNKIVYKDDTQVIDLHIKKVYSAVAGVDVMVAEV
jgi:Holliday junction resolvase RusA-like endonuclease